MRKFPNFLDAYFAYARDNFCPDSFHEWIGLSILAGALERKVWVNQGMVMHYPNIFTLLVSHPGVGKSTAIDRGVDLLEEIRETLSPDLKIIPNQITEPGLIEMMRVLSEMTFGPKIVFHSSGYFYASEASASALQNLFGDFNATITALYDCPKVFRKKLKSEKEITEIPNACFNLLAGATFDYLKNLVNEQSVMGGLASRFIYVISKDRQVREAKWDESIEVDEKMRQALIHDLALINKIKGRFTASTGFIESWKREQPEFDRYLIGLNSPRMESIMARKMTNLMKICMLLSVAENDRLELNESHWERGKALIEDVTKDNAFIITQAVIADKQSQNGVTQMISQALKKNGGKMNRKALQAHGLGSGNNVEAIQKTIDFMLNSGWLACDSSQNLTLLIDPDRHL